MTESDRSIMDLLTTYRVGVGVIVPVAIVIIGAVGKKISCGLQGGWEREDLYAGTELTLAGLSGVFVNLFDFLKPERVTFGLLENRLLGGNLLMLVLGFIVYEFTLSFKQDYGPHSSKSRAKQLLVMVGISNLLGFCIPIWSPRSDGPLTRRRVQDVE